MDITEIGKLLVELIFAAVGAFLIPWLRSHAANKNLTTALKWVEIAVEAADQLYEANQGREKKSFVVDFLKDRGFVLNEKELDLAIEAAVLKLHKQISEFIS